MMHLRKSRVLRRIKEGKVAFSMKLNLADPRCAEMAAMTGGFDCIWIDMEHVPTDYSTVENIVRAAKIYDCDVLCRVARGSYSDLVCPFEADCTGIMAPHLMSLEEARKIVYYTKFAPIGRRPLDGGNADGKYGMVDGLDYIKEANEERFTVVQIEDPEPLPELEEICALPGIDMIFFGPADFSQGIGKTCQFGAKEIGETRKLIAETARKYGKMAGTVGSTANAQELIDLGYNFINLGADVVGLGAFFGGISDTVKEKFNK